MFGLSYLFASANAFNATPIPEELASLVNLQKLGLMNAALSGAIPTFLGALTNLVFLDLDNNDLTGNIPTELGQLTNMILLMLNRNDLSGAIPAEIANLKELRVAFFDQNDLTGSLVDVCLLDNFQETPGDLDGTAVMIADCATGGGGPVDCPCCESCCGNAVAADNDGCNDYGEIVTFDPTWAFDYNRLSFTFDNETSFFVSGGLS